MKFISFKEELPIFYKTLPGLIRGQYFSITGYTGSAKSFLMGFLFLLLPYRYCKKNKMPLKIIVYALEDSYPKFWLRMKSELLRNRYGLYLTYYQFIGAHEGMTDAHKKALLEIESEVEEMKKYIIVIDDVKNPTGIRKRTEEELAPLGRKILGEKFTDEQGNEHQQWTWEYYDPDQQVIIITDHVGILSREKNMGVLLSEHDVIGKHSEYCRDVYIKKYNAIVCDVHQQVMSGDGLQAQKQDALEPSLSKFGKNLEVVQNYMTVLAIFDPKRYGLKKYEGIDITKYPGFRSIQILKHRDGNNDDKFAFQFFGTPYFKEV
jgi:hypothetical protein